MAESWTRTVIYSSTVEHQNNFASPLANSVDSGSGICSRIRDASESCGVTGSSRVKRKAEPYESYDETPSRRGKLEIKEEPENTWDYQTTSSRIRRKTEPYDEIPSGRCKFEIKEEPDNTDSSNDINAGFEMAASEMKVCKLEMKEEPKITDSSNDIDAGNEVNIRLLQDLLREHDPQMNGAESLIRIFKHFVQFFMYYSPHVKKGVPRNKPHFKVMLQYFKDEYRHSNPLLFDLVKDAFRELHQYLQRSWKHLPKRRKRLDRHEHTNRQIALLLRKLLPDSQIDISNILTVGKKRYVRQEPLEVHPSFIEYN